MLQLTSVLAVVKPHQATLSLPIDKRIKSRLRVTLDDGREAGLFLPRGLILRDGDLVESAEGVVVLVRAADEAVSTIHCADAVLLTRVAYHLGNRHVSLQVAAGFVRYQHDHVLDDMVRGLGGDVVVEQAPFEPEAGAYHNSKHGGHHNHEHHDH
ncbi:urease accessory protein UreE [Neptunomonas antarctica]|uniref:Urease accessory protein UreE n=1 Tax=Neptunomonas antarctica TaxID=619304 RepID=A0A1N7J4T9_9GAMM|nr:urease accessory protein UreE [Neptunomonas antarctica]SIS44324.1 urease accessory protein [Neptunomonas antarctica]